MPHTPRFNIPLEPGDLAPESLATLGAREQRFVSLRYGANGFQPHSLREVCDVVGLTPAAISNVVSAAARKLLALREPQAPIETEIVCANMPQDAFPGVADRSGTKVYRLTVDVVVDIGDREGGYWALRGVGKPKLKEVRR